MDLNRRVPPLAWEIAAASILVIWRVVFYPLDSLWTDWVLILSLYWIFTAWARPTHAWPVVTLVLMLGLLALYASRQIPLILDVLRFSL